MSAIEAIPGAAVTASTQDQLYDEAAQTYGPAWMMLSLHRKGSAKKMPEGADTLTGLRFYRAELERQLDVVRSVWSWYLAPMVPGFVVFTVGSVIPPSHPAAWAKAAFMDVVVAGMFFWVWKLNAKAARCLTKMIEELKAAE